MKNWRNSNEFRLMQPLLRPNDEIVMPEIATGAFKLKRNNKIYKVRRIDNKYSEKALEIHKYLLSLGWDLPKICGTETINNITYSYVEWIEGETFREYRERLHIDSHKLPEEYYYKLGQFASKLHNLKLDGKNIAVLNFWQRNNFIKNNGDITYLDLNKLYLTDFPECFAIKGIVAETPTVKKSQADAFLKGYRENREWDYEKIFKKYYSLFDIDYDVYLKRKFFLSGKKPFWEKWHQMRLPEDMTGMYILILSYGSGMFALECALRGAKRVYAISNQYVNIGSAHHRMSDIGKMLSVYHGFTENELLYKHMDIDTDWFVNEHIYDSIRYIPTKKYDMIITNVFDTLAIERKPKFSKMLSDCTKQIGTVHIIN